MRVVLAVPSWSLNGPVVFASNLTRGFLARGIDARLLITRPDWRDAKPLPRPSGLQIDTLLPGQTFVPASRRWAAMIRYLEDLAPCVYVPNHDFWHSCVAPRLSSNIAICGILHSDDPEHYAHAARLGRYWDHAVAVSSHIGLEIPIRFPWLQDRFSVIPYGVSAAVEWPERSSRGPLRVIYAGRLESSQKRVEDLLRITQEARGNHGVPVALTIAGSGPAEAALHQLSASTGLDEHVHFCGTLAPQDVIAEFRKHDVFLLPSAFEGLPLAMLEAMGQGCIPVVTRTRSGAPEIIQEGVNGLLGEIGNTGQMARHLAAIHGDRDLAVRMSQAAHATIRDGKYSVEAMTRSYADLFQRLLSKRFDRPAGGRIARPPQMPWTEVLPGPVQQAGDWLKRRLGWKV